MILVMAFVVGVPMVAFFLFWVLDCIGSVNLVGKPERVEKLENRIQGVVRRSSNAKWWNAGIGLIWVFCLGAVIFSGRPAMSLGWSVVLVLLAVLGIFSFFLVSICVRPALRVGGRVIHIQNDGDGVWSLHVRRSGPLGFVRRRMPSKANSLRIAITFMIYAGPALHADGIKRVRAVSPDAPAKQSDTTNKPNREKKIAEKLPAPWRMDPALEEPCSKLLCWVVALTRLQSYHSLTLNGVQFHADPLTQPPTPADQSPPAASPELL